MVAARSPQLSIIVPFLAGSPWIERCVVALQHSVAESDDHELIIVANGLPSEAPPPLDGQPLLLLRSEVNLGFGGGCNWAAQHARGEFLVFLNDDAIVEAGWLDELQGAAKSDSSVGAVGSLVGTRRGDVQEAGRVLWRDGVSHPIAAGRPVQMTRLPDIREVDYCSACSMLVRRSAWDQAGGFDPRYFPAYYEDSDLCMALRCNGWKVLCASGSRVRHEGSASTDPALRRFLGLRNHRLFVDKWVAALPVFRARPRDEPLAAEIEEAAADSDLRRIALTDLARREPEKLPALSPNPNLQHGSLLDDAAVVDQQLFHLKAQVRLQDEYISYLGATRPEMLRALAHLLRVERGRARRRELLHRIPIINAAVIKTRRFLGKQGRLRA